MTKAERVEKAARAAVRHALDAVGVRPNNADDFDEIVDNAVRAALDAPEDATPPSAPRPDADFERWSEACVNGPETIHALKGAYGQGWADCEKHHVTPPPAPAFNATRCLGCGEQAGCCQCAELGTTPELGLPAIDATPPAAPASVGESKGQRALAMLREWISEGSADEDTATWEALRATMPHASVGEAERAFLEAALAYCKVGAVGADIHAADWDDAKQVAWEEFTARYDALLAARRGEGK